MGIYEFAISLNGGYCEGSIEIEANSYDEAYTKAQDVIVKGLKNFPLSVSYDLDCLREPDWFEEIKFAFEEAIENNEVNKESVYVMIDRKSNLIYIGYHDFHNYYSLSKYICDAGEVNLDELKKELDTYNIKHYL